MDAPWLWLIPLLPFAGALLNGLLHARVLRARAAAGAGHPAHGAGHGGHGGHGDAAPHPLERWAGILGTLLVAGAFLVAVRAFFSLRGLEVHERVLRAPLETWIRSAELDVGWSLVVDPLSCTLVLVITGVGALIHLYSTGYMHGDRGYAKYFAYLNLFVGMMLMLVLSDSLVGLFLGWEGVGLCSYLLIGFWYEDGAKSDAARKAFIVNRIGDFGFLIGMFLLFWWNTGAPSLNLAQINQAAADGQFAPGVLTLACLCLFLGCCGKSAQIPLHVWLPDAMAGPTPVSALIHAATMVTSGIYLVARLSPAFAHAPGVLHVIALVGAATALFSASIALAQRDIKKVLAYSTVSQLGYMFLGLGVGAFGAAVYHLVTHAFFKALLFLGAGSVIHALAGEQDMLRMGGLRKYVPVTYRSMLLGACALAGIPLFSGFFSKDEILFSAATGPYGAGNWLLWLLGSAGALLTAVYTGRLLGLSFFGPERFDRQRVHPHESPRSMTIPLVVLAFLSLAGGVLGNLFLHPLEEWLHPVVGGATVVARGEHHAAHALEVGLLLFAAAVAAGGTYYGWRRFRTGVEAHERQLEQPGLLRTLADAWHVDALYDALVVAPLKRLAAGAAAFDTHVIDGAVNLAGAAGRAAGGAVRRIQSGFAAHYALWFSLGAAILLLGLWLGARA